MSESKEAKQQFLYKEIIEKQYNPDKFFFFITQKKDDGANLDLWSISELQHLVEEFKDQEHSAANEQEEEEETQFDSQQMDQQNQNDKFEGQHGQNQDDYNHESLPNIQENEVKSSENINSNEQNDLNQEPDCKQSEIFQKEPKNKGGFEYLEDLTETEFQKESMQEIFMKKHNISESFLSETIKCQKLNITIPIHRKIKIIATDPQKQVGYLFGLTGNYTLFKIITKPYDWSVQRRMTDFVAFRQILQKLFPGKLLPPLDPNLKENNDIELQKRLRFLCNFLNDLRHSSCIWYHPYTISFLSDSKEKWEKTMKQGEKEKQSEKIKCNLSGELQIRFSNENYEYKEELEGFMNQSESHYNKLYYLSKQLQEDFKTVSGTLKQISDVYYNLFTDINSFNGKIVEGQVSHKKLGDSYYIQGQIFDNWSTYMKKSINEIENMTNQYKYSFNEVKVQKELYKNCTEAENIFIKYQQVYQAKLQSEKIQFDANDDSETQYYEQMKSDYVYWLTQLCQESQRLYAKKGDDNIKFLNYIAQSESGKINEFIKAWQDVTQAYIKSPFPVPREHLKKPKEKQ